MEWTPEAKEAFKQVPPAIQKTARLAVEAHVRNKGLGVVDIELLEEAKAALMGGAGRRSDEEEEKSDLNMGVNRRHSMRLGDNENYFANETTGDPLHDAFESKMAVHAMPKGTPIGHEKLSGTWKKVMQGMDGVPLRTLYIHIPFCETHCRFCGFYQNPYTSDSAEKYVKALIEEIKLTSREPFVKSHPFHAVYFGGGTPTALAPESLAEVIDAVQNNFSLTNDCEITLEGRIHNFTHEKIDAAINSGINRISLGVQTFDSKIRKSLGRIEKKEKIIESLNYLSSLGKAAIIIDLIYGLPGQSLKIWEEDIKTFLSLEIDGCDLYQLNVFRGGKLEEAVKKDLLPKPATLKEQADYFVLGVELMKAAHFRRLSIPHWAGTTRERSLYNIFSRGRGECVPLGAGAGGWLQNCFFFVEGDLQEYFKAIEAGQKPLSFGMTRPAKDLLFRDISYQIELGYCDLKDLASLHKLNLLNIVQPVISQWEKAGLVKITGGCLYLTLPGEFWAVNLAQMLIDCLQKKIESDTK
ncbi:MAG: heme anaerobic degradation radical SAM methyltransferase ChuW/HutW [Desulfosarcina sp.]|nr:heme anaerobic degradation radical SAM methyltransferase ChuW/HutW [Desulfobacterales bacterium]